MNTASFRPTVRVTVTLMAVAAMVCIGHGAAARDQLDFRTQNQTSLHDPTAPRVELEADTPGPLAAGHTVFAFQLVDTKNNRLITADDLAVAHERRLHFIMYDTSLNEFLHVHPEYRDGHWEVALDVPRSGHYWQWAQGVLAADGTEFSAPLALDVQNGAPAYPLPPRLPEARTSRDGNSVVQLDGRAIRAEKMALLDVTFTHEDGTAPELSDYLGARAHVTIVPTDADEVLHVHPMNGARPNTLMLHTTFPSPGAYRLWIEFVDGGVLKRVPLAVQVQP